MQVYNDAHSFAYCSLQDVSRAWEGSRNVISQAWMIELSSTGAHFDRCNIESAKVCASLLGPS